MNGYPGCKIWGAGAVPKISPVQVQAMADRVASFFGGPGGFDGVDWTRFTASGLGVFQETFDNKKVFFTSSDKSKRDGARDEASKCCQSAYDLSTVKKAFGSPRTATWITAEDEMGRPAISLRSDKSLLVVSFAKVDDSLKIAAIDFRMP